MPGGAAPGTRWLYDTVAEAASSPRGAVAPEYYQLSDGESGAEPGRGDIKSYQGRLWQQGSVENTGEEASLSPLLGPQLQACESDSSWSDDGDDPGPSCDGLHGGSSTGVAPTYFDGDQPPGRGRSRSRSSCGSAAGGGGCGRRCSSRDRDMSHKYLHNNDFPVQNGNQNECPPKADFLFDPFFADFPMVNNVNSFSKITLCVSWRKRKQLQVTGNLGSTCNLQPALNLLRQGLGGAVATARRGSLCITSGGAARDMYMRDPK